MSHEFGKTSGASRIRLQKSPVSSPRISAGHDVRYGIRMAATCAEPGRLNRSPLISDQRPLKQEGLYEHE